MAVQTQAVLEDADGCLGAAWTRAAPARTVSNRGAYIVRRFLVCVKYLKSLNEA